MYLSRVKLNSRRRDTIRALASPQIIHASVEASFPSTDINNRNLWRMDTLSGHYWLIVLSRQKPDFTHIVEQFGWPASDQKWETKNYGLFLGHIKKEQVWRFRLCANPVYSAITEEYKQGKLYPHVTNRQQKEWLYKRAEKNGFIVSEDLRIIERDIKRFSHGENYVTLSVAVFEGVLSVENEELFTNALRFGVGRAKAYGCGLLTLAK